MPDAMVTARILASKKESGNRVFESLGVTPSQAINSLYDYVIREKALPFSGDCEKRVTAEQLREAQLFIRQIPNELGIADSRFSNMTNEQIKVERLMSRGLFDAEGSL